MLRKFIPRGLGQGWRGKDRTIDLARGGGRCDDLNHVKPQQIGTENLSRQTSF
jgi:hypothetical protein